MNDIQMFTSVTFDMASDTSIVLPVVTSNVTTQIKCVVDYNDMYCVSLILDIYLTDVGMSVLLRI